MGSSSGRSTASPGPTETSSRCSARTRSGARRTGRSKGAASTPCSSSGTESGGGWRRPFGSARTRRTRSRLNSSHRSMYRRLDGTRIVETLERLRQRIGERFPGSGLERVSGDLLDAASESMARVTDLRRPNVPLRIATWALIAMIVFVAVEALLHLRLAPRWEEFAGFLQSSQAIQNVVFLGLAVLFLANVETRIKRRRALAALHELRSIAHIVDMHQLTKDPDQFLAQGTMTRFELSRYLDYCSELLSLTSKVAALYVQDSQDPVLLDAVNDVETLTTGLSRKIWQKIMIIDTLEPSRRLT